MDELSIGSWWKSAVTGPNRRSSWSTTVSAMRFISMRARRPREIWWKPPTRHRLPCRLLFPVSPWAQEQCYDSSGSSEERCLRETLRSSYAPCKLNDLKQIELLDITGAQP